MGEKPKTNELEKSLEEMPKITLTILENTAVNTKTQKEYDNLMRVCESAGWLWRDGDLPSNLTFIWTNRKTCIDVGEAYPSEKRGGVLSHAPRKYFETCERDIISPEEFYKKQNITKETRKEIERYFEKKIKEEISTK